MSEILSAGLDETGANRVSGREFYKQVLELAIQLFQVLENFSAFAEDRGISVCILPKEYAFEAQLQMSYSFEPWVNLIYPSQKCVDQPIDDKQSKRLEDHNKFFGTSELIRELSRLDSKQKSPQF